MTRRGDGAIGACTIDDGGLAYTSHRIMGRRRQLLERQQSPHKVLDGESDQGWYRRRRCGSLAGGKHIDLAPKSRLVSRYLSDDVKTLT